MTQVFISYSRKDLAFVERLAKDLKAAGLEVWYDLSGLDGGARWGQEIQTAIEASQIFVVVLSPNSVGSEWVEKEFMYANSLKKRIIPLLYQPCKIPMWFINLHFIDVQGDNYDSHFWVILKAMGIKPGDIKKEVKTAVEAPSIQVASEGQILSAPPVVLEKQKNVQLGRKIKIFPLLIIALVVLVSVLAFAVWGYPALAVRPKPTLTATATSMPTLTPTMTLTLEPSLTPTITLTPTPALQTRPADGMVMVYVPAGNFSMGLNDGDPIDELHNVFLNAYWIDKTEVTNAMYALCVKAGACQAPSQSSSFTRSSYYGNSSYADYPVIFVNWTDAEGYCAWAGARLPTEAQWEKAARGTGAREYPWGDAAPICSLGNFVPANGNTTCVGDTSAVAAYPAGASPYGALDMAGNVWEWVSDWFDGAYYANSPASNPQGPSSGIERSYRGGGWDNYIHGSFGRDRNNPGYSSIDTGFRCARPAP